MEAYGKRELSFVDRFGVHLSRKPILSVLGRYHLPTILDVGCGFRAELLVDVHERIARGVGIDQSVSDEAKAVANLELIEATVEEALPRLDGRRFEVITLISVLEHLWDPQVVLTRLRKLLVSGGSLVVNVPNWIGKEFLEIAAFRFSLSPAGIDDHKMYYGKRDLWPLLVRSGFRPSRIAMRYHKFGLNLFAVARAD